MNKWMRIILSIITSFVLIGAIYVGYNNTRLQKIIVEQDKMIKNAEYRDKDFLKKARSYKDSVKNYTEQIYFLNGNKKMTSDQFIQLFNLTQNEKDSLAALLDDHRFLLNYARKKYGFDVFLTHVKNTSIADSRWSKADSAAITYKYFKGRLKKTPTGWTIDTFGDEKDKKKLREALKNYNERNIEDSIKNRN